MKKINVAIVGLGFGAEFIPIYQRHPNANMYAICQRDPKKLQTIGEAFGVEKRYSDYKELLKDPNVDAVHINSPIPDHAWMSIDALKAGKPMCSAEEGRISVDMCLSANRAAETGKRDRHTRILHRLRNDKRVNAVHRRLVQRRERLRQ